jgi:acetyl esterase/lipase
MTRLAHPSLSRRRLLHGSVLAGAAASLSTWPGPVLAQSTPEARPTPVAVEQTREVVYGEVDDTPLLLDVMQLAAEREAPRPAVVLFHGGGLIFGSRSDVFEPFARLAQASYVTFSVDYRLFDGQHRVEGQCRGPLHGVAGPDITQRLTHNGNDGGQGNAPRQPLPTTGARR